MDGRPGRLVRTTLLLDTAATAVVLIALSTRPFTPAAILVPLLVFEYVLKLGRPGLGPAVLVLTSAILARSLDRAAAFGLAPRYPLIVLVVSASGLLSALALALRAEERARLAAGVERDRIRQAFRDAVEEALRQAGASKEWLDTRAVDELVRRACSDPAASQEVGRRVAALLAPDPRLGQLTRREREIAGLLGAGLSDREIALRLFVSPVTVRVHVCNVMAKLGVGTREELRRALPAGPAPTPAPTSARPPVTPAAAAAVEQPAQGAGGGRLLGRALSARPVRRDAGAASRE